VSRAGTARRGPVWRPAWTLNIRHLGAHRLRFLLSAAGVASGVALAVAVGGLSTSINQAVTDVSLAAASKADLEVRPLTDVGMPEAFLATVRSTPGAAVSAATVESRTKIRTGGPHGQVKSVYLIGFEPGILALSPATFPSSQIGTLDPTGLLVPEGLADRLGIEAKESVDIYAPEGWRPIHVGGILEADRAAPPAVVATGMLVAQDVLKRPGRIDAVYVDARGDPQVVGRALREALGPSVRIGPPGFRTDDVRQMTASIQVILNVAALVALFVGGFLVYNTMSMAAVERVGEGAILRAIGATRRQALTVFAAEGALLGVLGSVLGLIGGGGLAKILLATRGEGLEAIVPVEVTRLALSPRDFALAGLAGVAVALAAALGPARRVAWADPAPNLGPAATLEEPARPPTWRAAVVGVVTLGSGFAMAALWFASPTPRLIIPMAGLFLFLVGVAVVIRTLVPLLAAKVLAPAVSPTSSVKGTLRLAAGETLRSPGRTAFTVGALVLALALVVGFQNGIDAFQRSFGQGLSVLIRADVLVRSLDWAPYGGGSGISPAVAQEVSGIPGVQSAYPSRRLVTWYQDHVAPLIAIDVEGYRRYTELPGFTPGQQKGNARMAQGGVVLISPSAADRFGMREGQRVEFDTPTGKQSFEIAGIYEDPSAVLPTFYVTFEDVVRYWGLATADTIDVFLEPGASDRQVAAEIERRFARYEVKADTRPEFLASVLGIVKSLNALVGSVQLVAVVVAALGVANTLLMSTLERRRDLGVLRALGMMRRQLRRMIVLEALLIGGLGVVLAWGVGTGVGMFAHKLAEIQTSLEIPLVIEAPVYIGVAVLGIGVTGLAALYPAHRVSRLGVTEALQYE
jgi:putative ABC transport system permease protein